MGLVDVGTAMLANLGASQLILKDRSGSQTATKNIISDTKRENCKTLCKLHLPTTSGRPPPPTLALNKECGKPTFLALTEYYTAQG